MQIWDRMRNWQNPTDIDNLHFFLRGDIDSLQIVCGLSSVRKRIFDNFSLRLTTIRTQDKKKTLVVSEF